MELMQRLTKTNDSIVARNYFEKNKLALIKEKFGSMSQFKNFVED